MSVTPAGGNGTTSLIDLWLCDQAASQPNAAIKMAAIANRLRMASLQRFR
jgi:hypothetical protein